MNGKRFADLFMHNAHNVNANSFALFQIVLPMNSTQNILISNAVSTNALHNYQISANHTHCM